LMDVVVERCAGLDVHRDSVVATVRLPGTGKSRRRREQQTRSLVRPSFVPPPEIRRLRDLTRLCVAQTEERTRAIQRLEKVLQDAGIKLSSSPTTACSSPVCSPTSTRSDTSLDTSAVRATHGAVSRRLPTRV
jgi:hypothetical protein